jgi:predicted lysophospholipase L1 biosynthesis ABC-type transport system permease subunit
VATLPGVLAGGIAAVGAVAGAIALSPFFPTGRVRAFEPHPGLALHLVVLGAGFLLVAGMVAGAFAFAAWRAEQRIARVAPPNHADHAPRLVPRAQHWRLGATSFMGTRFAVERGPERRSVPVRTSLAGTAAGVAGVVAALTFAASLNGFLSEPSHYGQPWDLSIETLGAEGAPRDLAANPDVAAAALVRSLDVYVDGHRTTVNAVTPLKGSLEPTLESGRLPQKEREIALGPRLLATTGSGIGDTVVVRIRRPVKLVVVGTALNVDPQDETFGTTGFVTAATLHRVRGTAALYNEETALRFRAGVDVDAATRRIKQEIPFGLTDESLPNRPAAVDNVAELGRLPEILAGVLAVIGLVAVAHAVVLAVRRRRRELAVLAALGMTRWQRARIVMAMAATMVGLGLLIGVPIGALVGTFVWGLIAQDLRVDWAADVPVLTIAAIAVVSVAIALVISLLPARNAGRVGPAAVLRTG